MSLLGKFIHSRTPKFNKEAVEGLCYHKLKDAVDYLDAFTKYTALGKTDTFLKYLGYRELKPEEVVKLKFKNKNSFPYDMAENSMFLVEYSYQYGDEEEIRKHNTWVPFMEPGNRITIGGKKILTMPVLADKVISVGEVAVFINITTAKHNFLRNQFTILENNSFRNITVVVSELYKGTVKRHAETTKCRSSILHYLLAYHGYSKAMEIVLGWVPEAVYDPQPQDGKVIYRTTGMVPRGWVKPKESYVPNRIGFVVPEELNTPNVSYVLGNVLYVLDNFPNMIMINQLDHSIVWRRFMGEIIHTGNHSFAKLEELMHPHFDGFNSVFDVTTIHKLSDIGVDATNIIELLAVIFINFNDWILSKSGGKSLYHTKTLEVESFILNRLTSNITRLFLDINKDELRNGNKPLESNVVDKTFKTNLKEAAIFSLRSEKLYTTSMESTTDSLYFKMTAHIVNQESDATNVKSGTANTSTKTKLAASMATVGSYLNLSKKNPTPTIRMNPYINIDYLTGTVLPDMYVDDIVQETQLLLEDTQFSRSVSDITDEDVGDIGGFGDDDDLVDMSSFDEDGSED